MTTILVPEINIWTPEVDWPEWMKRAKARIDKVVVAGAIHGPSGPVVSMNTANHSKSRFSSGTAYAILRLNTNGNEDANTTGSSNVLSAAARGTWLDGGSSSDVWVERTIDFGTALNNGDPGSGRIALTTNPTYGNLRSANGSKSTTVTFDFYDAVSGGNLLQSNQIIIVAIVDFL